MLASVQPTGSATIWTRDHRRAGRRLERAQRRGRAAAAPRRRRQQQRPGERERHAAGVVERGEHDVDHGEHQQRRALHRHQHRRGEHGARRVHRTTLRHAGQPTQRITATGVRALLVVNPAATTSTPRTRDVLARALGSEMKLEVAETSHRGHAAELAGRAMREGLDLVVALGGDGTVNEVVNGLLDRRPEARPAGAGRGARRLDQRVRPGPRPADDPFEATGASSTRCGTAGAAGSGSAGPTTAGSPSTPGWLRRRGRAPDREAPAGRRADLARAVRPGRSVHYVTADRPRTRRSRWSGRARSRSTTSTSRSSRTRRPGPTSGTGRSSRARRRRSTPGSTSLR